MVFFLSIVVVHRKFKEPDASLKTSFGSLQLQTGFYPSEKYRNIYLEAFPSNSWEKWTLLENKNK